MSTRVEDPLHLRPLTELTLGDRAIDTNAIPWIPYTEGIYVKPLRLDLASGRWINLTKTEGAGMVNRHRHIGPVTGFVLEGSWRYLERDWVATKGTIVYEPPGDIHTLMSDPGGSTTLFQIEGALLYMDEDDNVVGQEDVFSFTKLYLDYCREHGIEPIDLNY
jgi:hypothetical protein